ncbi:MAG: hypothetical protein SFU87_14960 [Chitinophagaceae bacterium]|nr:hypothetical protein [Chitinophagaceae bacterium]
MTKLLIIIIFILSGTLLQSQELYIVTEPASNMATGSFGVRLTNRLMKMEPDGKYDYRLEPEMMFGISKHLMVHANLYASNMFQKQFRFEGAGLYAKYRFLSIDDVHSHFRMAAFGKITVINNPNAISHTEIHDMGGGVIHEEEHRYYSNEIELDGNNSGFNTGIVATQLFHKLAVSGSASYTNRWKNSSRPKESGLTNRAVNYSFSAGYLLLPREYKNYDQTNLNLYVEFLGAAGLDRKGYFIDAVPAIQFIFNSISRLDLAYRTQISGNTLRFNKSSWLLRFEYNFLNVFGKNK